LPNDQDREDLTIKTDKSPPDTTESFYSTLDLSDDQKDRISKEIIDELDAIDETGELKQTWDETRTIGKQLGNMQKEVRESVAATLTGGQQAMAEQKKSIRQAMTPNGTGNEPGTMPALPTPIDVEDDPAI